MSEVTDKDYVELVLGLPRRDISIGDPSIADAYSDFCTSLKRSASGLSIVCDSEIFLYGFNESQIEEIQSVRLLAELINPEDRDFELLRERIGYNENFKECLPEKHRDGPVNIRPFVLMREFEACKKRGGAGFFPVERVPSKTLTKLDVSVSSAPGITWYSSYVGKVFNPDWMILLCYRDSEDRAEAAFPYILGFASMENPRRAVAEVFLYNRAAHMGAPDWFGSYLNSAEDSDNNLFSPGEQELLSMFFSGFAGDDEPSYGEMLLSFPDGILDQIVILGLDDISDANMGWGPQSDEATELRKYCSRLLNLQQEYEVPPSRLIEMADRIDLNSLDKVEEVLEREQEEKWEKQRLEDERKIEKWWGTFGTVDPVDPLLCDRTFGEITPREVTGINRWLSENYPKLHLKLEMRYVPTTRFWRFTLKGNMLEREEWKFTRATPFIHLCAPETVDKLDKSRYEREDVVRKIFGSILR